MSRFSRSRETCGRTGQHHRRSLDRYRIAFVVLLLSAFPEFITAQSLLHIRVTEGEGAIHAAGAKDHRPITLQITDETGAPVEAATVSFRLPEEGPGGSFDKGMKTSIVTTAADGRAMIFGVHWNTQPGPFQVRATAIKGSVRAGVIISQFISDRPVGKDTASVRSGSKRWLLLAIVAGGGAAAAAGLATGKAKSPSAPPTAAPAPEIGMPTIVIGRPQ